MNAPLQRVVDALESHGCNPRKTGTGWSARCPAHDDKNPSLSVAEGDKHPVVLNCQAGCTPEAVLEALGLTLADVCEQTSGTMCAIAHKPTRKIQTADAGPFALSGLEYTAHWVYTDAGGADLFAVVRYNDEHGKKTYRQWRRNGTGWTPGLGDDTERVIYNLPAGIEAVKEGWTIYVVEGEKCADALNALNPDVTATTNPMGAGKWRPNHTATLERAAKVIVWADDNEPGKDHARQVAKSLRGVVADVSIVVSPHAHDAADHLAAGHGLDDVVPLDDEPDEFDDAALGRMSMKLVGAADAVETKWFVEDLIPIAALVLIAARWKVGKSMLAYWIALQILKAVDVLGTYPVVGKKLRVMIWQFEMPESVNVKRLRKLANGLRIKPETLVRWEQEGRLIFYAQSPISLKHSDGVETFHNRIEHHKPDIVLIDSAGEAGFSINDNEDVRAELRAAINPLLTVGRSVILLTHKRKGQAGGKPGQPDNEGDSILGAQSWGAKASRIYTLAKEGQPKAPGDFVVKLESQEGWDLTTTPAVYIRVHDACVGDEEATLLEPLDESQIQTEGYESKGDQAKRMLLEAIETNLYGHDALIKHLVEAGVAESTAKKAYRELTGKKKIHAVKGMIRSTN